MAEASKDKFIPSPQKSLKRNAALNMARTVMSLVFPLATFPYVSHILGFMFIGHINLLHRQTKGDVELYKIDTFVMGDDWKGKFDFLKSRCEVVYLERTPEISTTQIKKDLEKNGRE